jgi:hypothetical protein
MHSLLSLIARSTAFDVLGGLSAGVGINLVTNLYMVTPQDMKRLPLDLWWIAIGFIVSGAAISICRIILGSIRERAIAISSTSADFAENFRSECGVRGVLAGLGFTAGCLVTLYLILLMKR